MLEIPLDRQVAERLKKDGDKNCLISPLPKWDRIKTLTPEVSKRFQDCAKEVAKEKHTSRIYLDLEYWRGTNEAKSQDSR